MAYVEVQWGKALAPGPAYSGTDGTPTKHDNNKHDNTKRNGNNAQQGGNDAI